MDKTNRKGEVISRADVANELKSKIRLVSNQNDGLAELRRYDNGSIVLSSKMVNSDFYQVLKNLNQELKVQK